MPWQTQCYIQLTCSDCFQLLTHFMLDCRVKLIILSRFKISLHLLKAYRLLICMSTKWKLCQFLGTINTEAHNILSGKGSTSASPGPAQDSTNNHNVCLRVLFKCAFKRHYLQTHILKEHIPKVQQGVQHGTRQYSCSKLPALETSLYYAKD